MIRIAKFVWKGMEVRGNIKINKRGVVNIAERRMFAKTIIDSDAFLDMSSSARLLYFDLGMRADDDGIVNSPKKIMRMTGASEQDMTQLFKNRFIIPFKTGIVVVKHWKMNNYIRSDRYTQTKYKEELEQLELDENGSYRVIDGDAHIGIPDGSQMVVPPMTQGRLGKVSKTIEQKDLHDELFETLWKLYPNKKGKNRIKAAKKKEYYQIGEEEMTRAIKRYSKEVEGKEKQYIKHGSTFFKTDYVDYLDENYEEVKEVEQVSMYQDMTNELDDIIF